LVNLGSDTSYFMNGAPVASTASSHSPSNSAESYKQTKTGTHAESSSTREEEHSEQSNQSNNSKIFVGGLSWETTEETLQKYFESYGKVLDCVIMRDKHTGHPRGFGFVTFEKEESADRAATKRHEIDGRQVEAKKAVPKAEYSGKSQPAKPTRKVFVGGLPLSCTEEEFKGYFEKFGQVIEAHIMYDHQTGISRGFGFVTFASEDIVEKVFEQSQHDIKGKTVEVKKAEPKHFSEGKRVKDAAGNSYERYHEKFPYFSTEAGGKGPMMYPPMEGAAFSPFAPFGFTPAMAAQYAQYYGGTAASWQQYAAAAAAAAAAAGMGYFNAGYPTTGEMPMYANPTSVYSNDSVSQQESDSKKSGRSSGSSRRTSGKNERYHPYER
jgi:heterogeneous nuclear ribonucleoprotein A1/A3